VFGLVIICSGSIFPSVYFIFSLFWMSEESICSEIWTPKYWIFCALMVVILQNYNGLELDWHFSGLDSVSNPLSPSRSWSWIGLEHNTGRYWFGTGIRVLCTVLSVVKCVCVPSLQSSLRISPPLPFMMPGVQQRDPHILGTAVGCSRLDLHNNNSALSPEPPTLKGQSYCGVPLAKCLPQASVWPSWDLLEEPQKPFNIEREARLHRQAAGCWIRLQNDLQHSLLQTENILQWKRVSIGQIHVGPSFRLLCSLLFWFLNSKCFCCKK
jgi:hypothetical protein